MYEKKRKRLKTQSFLVPSLAVQILFPFGERLSRRGKIRAEGGAPRVPFCAERCRTKALARPHTAPLQNGARVRPKRLSSFLEFESPPSSSNRRRLAIP